MPSALNFTTLKGLTKKLLLAIDSYNSDDLAIETPDALTVDSLGERARLCLNLALHEIYFLVKDSKYLESYPSTAISSETDKDWVALDPEAFLDDIESVTETTNHIKLTRKSWAWYRRNFPDPSQTSGIPLFYIRRNDRLYLAPRPASAINYTIDFKKFAGDLKLQGDFPLLPTPFDSWIISEAKVHWYIMEDPSNVPPVVINERDNSRQNGISSVFTSYDRILQAGSNTETEKLRIWPYSRPVGQ